MASSYNISGPAAVSDLNTNGAVVIVDPAGSQVLTKVDLGPADYVFTSDGVNTPYWAPPGPTQGFGVFHQDVPKVIALSGFVFSGNPWGAFGTLVSDSLVLPTPASAVNTQIGPNGGAQVLTGGLWEISFSADTGYGGAANDHTIEIGIGVFGVSPPRERILAVSLFSGFDVFEGISGRTIYPLNANDEVLVYARRTSGPNPSDNFTFLSQVLALHLITNQ